MNLERGEWIYYRLLQLDMFGIWMSQSFGALPFVSASVFCMNGFTKWLTIGSYCLFCMWGLQKALTAGSPWQRRLCFALPFLMRVVLTILRLSKVAGGNPGAMTHVFLQVNFEYFLKIEFKLIFSLFKDGVSIFGGAIGKLE
jgi:hypothetical protein